MNLSIGTINPEWVENGDGAATACYDVERWLGGTPTEARDTVAEEVPVAMVYNGVSHAVMLATPADIEEFALGFSLSEGIIAHRRELLDFEIVAGNAGIEARMRTTAEREVALRGQRRALAGRTGCGLCGKESLAQAVGPCRAVGDQLRVTSDTIELANAKLPARQTVFACTGAAHAAAWCAIDGRVLLVREDIGRHNALDKLIGALASGEFDPATGFVLMTSRASYEIVQKAAAIGIELVAALSAPTGMAIRMAETAGVTLIGFVRDGRCTVYSHPRRLRRIH